MIMALRASTYSVCPHEQVSLSFALRAAVLRLAVRGLCSVARVVVVAVARAVVLGRVRCVRLRAKMRSWLPLHQGQGITRARARPNPVFNRTPCGSPRMALISFWAKRGLPQGAG
jgi:hypothetical protein